MSFRSWYEKEIVHPTAPRIAESMEEEPEKWEYDCQALMHRDLGIRVSMRRATYLIRPSYIRFGIFGALMVRRAGKRIIKGMDDAEYGTRRKAEADDTRKILGLLARSKGS